MKRIAFYFGIATALVASCSTQEKDFQTPQQEDVIYYASFEQPVDEGTRVYANEDLLLRWTADDRVSIFGKNTYNQQYKFLGETGDNSGGFNKVDGAEYVTGNPISHTVSVYPYRAATKITEDEVITVTLPAEQHYAENTFGLGDNTMVSVSEDNFLQYKTIGGFLVLKLYGEGVSVSSITLKGNNGEKLAGKATVTMSLDGVPSITMANDASSEITLSCATPVLLGADAENSTQFWFVVPPVSFSKGFTITVNESTVGIFEKSTSKSIAIERNKLSKMTAIEVEKSTPIGNIIFADIAAKYACVTRFDTNGDGEVSYEEAEAATSFSGLFDNWKGVGSFDEIRYFKNVHSLSGVFDGCNKLVSIAIPENITDLGTYTFNGCSALSSVALPSGITAIGDCTFRNCSSLVSVDIPSSVTSIGQYAFSGCYTMTSVNLPSGIIEIEEYTFQNCDSMVSINIPSNVTSIGRSAFSGCSSLTSIDLPARLMTIGEYAFSGCGSLEQVAIPNGISFIPAYCFEYCISLTSVSVPEGITYVGDYAFRDVKMWKLELPSSITSLGSACFGRIVCIILPSTSPVSIQSKTFDGVKGVFVPSNLIEMYGAMTNWANYSTRLHPISIYREKNEFTLATSGAVDMGTSVKWAAYNVGATKPEDYGDYYAWGETKTKSNYLWSTYFDNPNGDGQSFTKYFIGEGGKTLLDPEDDVAHVKWGGNWRMPQKEEWEALREVCYWEWTTNKGTNGYNVYGFGDGKIVFIPAAGFRTGTYLHDAGFRGEYWSSSLLDGSNMALNAHFNSLDVYFHYNSDDVYIYNTIREIGLSVRPVCD